MKAAVLFGKEDIRFEDNWNEPEVKPGHVKIQVKACGICGSDIPRVLGDAAHGFPIILGHEFSGVVAEKGDGVEGVEIGDHVVGVPLIPCNGCSDCEAGNYSLCKNYSFIGSRRDGGFAEYVVVPKDNFIVIDKSISFEEAAMFEPCTVAIHAIKHVGYKPGAKVAFLGSGTVGLFGVQAVKAFGDCEVTVFDCFDEKLDLAKKAGADHVVNTMTDDFIAASKEITDNRGFDYVFETAGSTVTIKIAFEIAGNKSSVCFIGTPKNELVFSVKEWENINRKEFKATGSWMSYSKPWPGSEWEDAARLFAEGKIRCIDGMIHKTFHLSGCREAFNMFKANAVKGKILFVAD